VPRISDGARIQTDASPKWIAAQASRKNSGGEFSPPVWTVLSTEVKL
jgi:hypothetical protein